MNAQINYTGVSLTFAPPYMNKPTKLQMNNIQTVEELLTPTTYILIRGLQ